MGIERKEIEQLKLELEQNARIRGLSISDGEVFTDILEHLARANELPFRPLSDTFQYMIPDERDPKVQALAEELRQKWS